MEHSGGVAPFGFEDHDQDSPAEVTPIVQFDLPEDTLEDLLAEHLATGGTLAAFVEGICRHEMERAVHEARLETINKLLDLAFASSRADLALKVIAWVIGRAGFTDESIQTIAKSCGVSKQAIQQDAAKYRRLFGIRSQSERSAQAKAKMRQNNYRHKTVPDSFEPAKVRGAADGRGVRRNDNVRRVGNGRKAGAACG